MSKKTAENKQTLKRQDAEHSARPIFPLLLAERQESVYSNFSCRPDEAFLIRADINKKLSSL